MSDETTADLDQRDRFPELTFRRNEWRMVSSGDVVVIGCDPAYGRLDDIMSAVRAVARDT